MHWVSKAQLLWSLVLLVVQLWYCLAWYLKHYLSAQHITAQLIHSWVAMQPPRDYHCLRLNCFLATLQTPPLVTLSLACAPIPCSTWTTSVFISPGLYLMSKWKSVNSTHLCPTAFNLAVLLAIELLAVSLHQYYLSREFSQAIMLSCRQCFSSYVWEWRSRL